jgi:DNA-binding LacI/PurR family transcriptional regulator
LLIGHAISYLTHPNGGLALAAMCGSAAELGYRILLLTSNPKSSPDARVMDACVVMGWVDEACAGRVAELAKRIPVITTYGKIPGAHGVVISSRRAEALATAAEYLYDLGHRHIAVVGVAMQPIHAIEGFRETARRRGVDARLVPFTDHWRERIYPTIDQICALQPLPSAVFAFDDDYARALTARLARDRRRVPEDVSVFSGDTHRDGFQTAPPLTGIAGVHERECVRVIQKLIEAMEQGQAITEIGIEPSPVELIVRASCAPRCRARGRARETQHGAGENGA